jgi:hypothetical protein
MGGVGIRLGKVVDTVAIGASEVGVGHDRWEIFDKLSERARNYQGELAASGEEARAAIGVDPILVRGVGEDDVDILRGEVSGGGADDLASVRGVAEGIHDEAGDDVAKISAEAPEAFSHDHGPADRRAVMANDQAVKVFAFGREHGLDVSAIADDAKIILAADAGPDCVGGVGEGGNFVDLIITRNTQGKATGMKCGGAGLKYSGAELSKAGGGGKGGKWARCGFALELRKIAHEISAFYDPKEKRDVTHLPA